MKSNKNQLELDLFEARKQIEDGLDKFTKAVLGLTREGQPVDIADDVEKMEKMVKRLVGHLAIRDFQGDYHKAWVSVYGQMGRQFGYHPAVLNEDPTKPHLEVCRKDRKIPMLLQAVRSLIQPTTV